MTLQEEPETRIYFASAADLKASRNRGPLGMKKASGLQNHSLCILFIENWLSAVDTLYKLCLAPTEDMKSLFEFCTRLTRELLDGGIE